MKLKIWNQNNNYGHKKNKYSNLVRTWTLIDGQKNKCGGGSNKQKF